MKMPSTLITKLAAILLTSAVLIGLSPSAYAAVATATNPISTELNCDTTAGSCTSSSDYFNANVVANAALALINEIQVAGSPSGPSSGPCSTNIQTGLTSCSLGSITLDCGNFGSLDGSAANCQLQPNKEVILSCDASTNICSLNAELNALCDANSAGAGACRTLVNADILCDKTGICPTMVRQTPRDQNIGGLRDIITRIRDGACAAEGLNNRQQNLCSFIENKSDEQLEEIVEAIIPDNADISADISSQNATQIITNLSNHIANLRSGAPAIAANNKFNPNEQQFYVEQQWLDAYSQFAQLDTANDGTNGDATINLSNDGRWSLYLNMSYLIAEQARTDTEGGSDTDTATLTIGSDYRINNNWTVGGSFAYSASSTEFGDRSGNEVDSDSFNLALYASMYYSQFWSDFTVLYGISQFDQAREVSCPASNPSCGLTREIYRADYDGSVTGISWSLGYDVTAGAFSFSPFLQLNTGTIDTDSYSEEGSATAIALLEFDNNKRDYGSVGIGSYLRYVINTKKAVFVPTLRLISTHSTEDESQSISGRIVDSEDSDFSFAASSGDRNYLLIGAGFSFQLQNGNSGFIDIESLELFDDTDQYRFSAGWRWEL